VAGLVADLKNALDEEFDPLLLKALLIHSGNYPLDSTIPIKERIKFFGFGKPKNVKGILYNDNHNSTLILRDELFRSEKIDIFDFPMPDIMINNGYYTGDITVTIVYSPILNINQGSEYSQSDIDIKFGTYDNIKERDITKSNILNKFGRNISVNTLLPSFFSSKKISGNLSDFSLREHTLIKYLDKYYPVKKYSFSLEDAAPNNKAKHLVSNRKWYLYLKGIYRDNAECLSEMAGEELSQKFCLIITISDPTHTKNVYDGVVQKLNEHNFWNTNIKLRADIKIEV
jgi:hypothetical protein